MVFRIARVPQTVPKVYARGTAVAYAGNPVIYTPTSESIVLKKANALIMISFSLTLQSRRISWTSLPTADWGCVSTSIRISSAETFRVLAARVTVNFGTNHRIVLPDRCIVKQEGTGQRFVYLLNNDDTVSYVPVTIGRHIGSEYEVVDGVAEGATVVSKGQATLKDGVKVVVLN